MEENRRIAGYIDSCIFGVDHDIVWDIVSNKIPELKEQITKILKKRR
jgi:uncharacterized protein with HEPN domain